MQQKVIFEGGQERIANLRPWCLEDLKNTAHILNIWDNHFDKVGNNEYESKYFDTYSRPSSEYLIDRELI